MSKVIDDTKDPLEDDDFMVASTANVIITQTDYDWILPEGPEEEEGEKKDDK